MSEPNLAPKFSVRACASLHSISLSPSGKLKTIIEINKLNTVTLKMIKYLIDGMCTTELLGDDVMVLGPDAFVARRVAGVVPLCGLHAGGAGRLAQEGGGGSLEPELEGVERRQLAEFLPFGVP